MYNKELIYRDAKQIMINSKNINPYVVIAQPRRSLTEIPAQSFDKNFIHIDMMGFSHGFIDIGGEKVDVARNYLIEMCINSGAKYMFFIGEDTVIPYDGFIKLHKTCEHNPNSIAIGVYYIKTSSPMVSIEDNNTVKVADVSPHKEPFKVQMAGMDAMLIPISILKKMKDEEPDNPFCCIISDIQIDEETHVDFIGEDNYFYNRCKNAKIPILCNTNVQCLHMDLATGKYTAYEDIDLSQYMTNIPIAERLTLKDKFYLDSRWTSRLPEGSYLKN